MALAALLFTSCYSVAPVGSTANTPAGGIYYALPFTQICIDVTYQYYDLSEAVYSEFASEMLALDNFDVERPYRIKDIQATYSVTADPEHYYFVSPDGISLQVDNRHLLRSIGMTPQEAAEAVAAALEAAGIEGGEAELVVLGPLVRIGKHLISLVGLLEAGFAFLVAGMEIGMVLLGRLPVSLFDLVCAGVLVYAQHLIIIAFISHLCFPLLQKRVHEQPKEASLRRLPCGIVMDGNYLLSSSTTS